MFETKIYFSFENNKQLKKIIKYISQYFYNFSLYKLIGYYHTIKEKSRIIEYISEFKLSYVLDDIREYIKETANQKEVLITEKEIIIK